MKRLIKISLLFAATLCLCSCLTSSTKEINHLDSPNSQLTKDFGIKIEGTIKYQFYQKYGFNDQKEQLILILTSESTDFLTSSLPLDSADYKRLDRIDLRKLTPSGYINFEPEKSIHEDILIEAQEFGAIPEKRLRHLKGKYLLEKSGSNETFYLFDKESGLLYIESKK